ncbi:N-acetylmuramoyl-L-alanine amidase [Chondromyces crocatus]|uniref:N-acetylmuramoyl-L-alanine amidase n=1 Tax=Chondromyces crocatus TaxID=52 RepID=A0A0K1ESB8_CHOCO|nr:N-acetylmuramoyl-L-alanine amidase [Chondromyces crocatus]AKT43756.1 uncharacterized protein CMC5_079920 [Chondromyces crocatus]
MDLLRHEVAPGESLYGIARQHNTDIRNLQVVRGDRTFDLGAPDNGFDPTSLNSSDTVLVPNASQQSACGVQGCGTEAEAQAALANADTQTLTPQGEAIEKDCAAAEGDLSNESPCEKPRYVIVIDPGHGGTSSKDNLTASSWTNAIGAVSDVLEKTMTQRFAALLKQTLDGWAGKFTSYVDIKVLLTKTDENVNLSAKDRATIAKDEKADIFFIIHFNSLLGASLFSKNNLIQEDGEQAIVLDLTPGYVGETRNQPEGFKRRLFSTTSSTRGPQRVKRTNKINADPTLVTSDALSKVVVNNVAAVMKQLDTTPSIRALGDFGNNVAILSRDNLGARGIACCFLEGDFINVESGDRLWNPVQYAANVSSLNGGTAVDASTLPSENAMFESGAFASALAIIMPILRTAVVPRSKQDLKTLVDMLDPQGGIKPVLEPEP